MPADQSVCYDGRAKDSLPNGCTVRVNEMLLKPCGGGELAKDPEVKDLLDGEFVINPLPPLLW